MITDNDIIVRLKKEQKKASREKLRSQEVTLIKQIEKYEQLITDGLAEVSDITTEPPLHSKPKIKSPVSSSKAERRAPSPRMKTPEMASLSSLSFVDEEIRDSATIQTVESSDVSTSTILASPTKAKTPDPLISEVIDENSSPVISSKSSSPVSKLKLIAEGKAPEILAPSPEKSRSSLGNNQTEYSSVFESERQDVPGKKVTETLVDSITESIWKQIVQETKSTFSTSLERPEVPASPPKTSPAKPRQKVRSQELTLAFDVGSSSEESSSARQAEEAKSEAEMEDEDDGEERELQEFLDDDFGLSSIKQEEEILRLQQVRVEEEIAALQRESDLLTSVPDKPPPPYQPPLSTKPPAKPAPPKPERPPPPRVVVPQHKEEILGLLQHFVTQIYQAKQAGLELTSLACPPGSLRVSQNLTETEGEFVRKYEEMLFSVTLEKVLAIYKFETLQQNPVWMEQLPLARLAYSAPRTLAQLVERVQREVSVRVLTDSFHY